MPEFRDMLEGLFIEAAIIEHLTRTRVGRKHIPGLDVAEYGILGYLDRHPTQSDTIRGIAWCFQEDEARVQGQIESLAAKSYVSLTTGLDPLDTVVTLAEEGRAVRKEALTQMAPDFLSIVSEIPEEDLRTCYRVIKDIRHVMDNLPER